MVDKSSGTSKTFSNFVLLVVFILIEVGMEIIVLLIYFEHIGKKQFNLFHEVKLGCRITAKQRMWRPSHVSNLAIVALEGRDHRAVSLS